MLPNTIKVCTISITLDDKTIEIIIMKIIKYKIEMSTIATNIMIITVCKNVMHN